MDFKESKKIRYLKNCRVVLLRCLSDSTRENRALLKLGSDWCFCSWNKNTVSTVAITSAGLSFVIHRQSEKVTRVQGLKGCERLQLEHLKFQVKFHERKYTRSLGWRNPPAQNEGNMGMQKVKEVNKVEIQFYMCFTSQKKSGCWCPWMLTHQRHSRRLRVMWGVGNSGVDKQTETTRAFSHTYQQRLGWGSNQRDKSREKPCQFGPISPVLLFFFFFFLFFCHSTSFISELQTRRVIFGALRGADPAQAACAFKFFFFSQ